MDSDVTNLRRSLKNQVAAPELLEIERFLLRVSSKVEKLSFSEDEKMGLACAYHQVWWFRDKQIKKYFAKDNRLAEFPAFILPEYQGAAERSLENLIARDAELQDRMNVPKYLIETVANTLKFLDRKAEQSGVKKRKLADFKIWFEDKTAELCVGELPPIQITPNTNHHYVLRRLFSVEKNEIVEWDELFLAMTGSEIGTTRRKDTNVDRKALRDAVQAINEKVKDECGTDDLLIEFRNKTVKRLY